MGVFAKRRHSCIRALCRAISAYGTGQFIAGGQRTSRAVAPPAGDDTSPGGPEPRSTQRVASSRSQFQRQNAKRVKHSAILGWKADRPTPEYDAEALPGCRSGHTDSWHNDCF